MNYEVHLILKYEDCKKLLEAKSSKLPRINYNFCSLIRWVHQEYVRDTYIISRMLQVYEVAHYIVTNVSIFIIWTTAIAETWSLSSYIYIEHLNIV